MKIDLNELKHAVQYLESHTRDLRIKLESLGNHVCLTAFDPAGHRVEIKLFEDSQIIPKITKTEPLRTKK